MNTRGRARFPVFRWWISLGVLAIWLQSCADVTRSVQSTFDSLKPGMSVTELSGALGSPDNLVGEVLTAYGHRVVVWEYSKTTSRVVLPSGHTEYWVYLVEGRYLKYAIKGDWNTESAVIYHTDYSDVLKHLGR